MSVRLFVAVVVMGMLMGASVAVAMNTGDLVVAKCSICHDTERICRALKQKGKGAWDKTVTMMMLKGADISIEEKEKIVNYLYLLDRDSRPVCEMGN